MTVPYGTTGWLDVPLTFPGMSLSGDHVWMLISTPNTGVASFTVSTSEAGASVRPEVTLNYTEVYALDVDTQQGMTHTAGSSVTVSSSVSDFNGASLSLPAGITLTVSDGSITTTVNGGGTWVPVTAGSQTVTACYGAICDTTTITVVADVPTTLVVDPLTATILSLIHI